MKKIIITAMAGDATHCKEVYGLSYLSGTGSDIPTPLEDYCRDRAREGVNLEAVGLDIGCGLNKSIYRIALNAAAFVRASDDFGLTARVAEIGLNPVLQAIAKQVDAQAEIVAEISNKIRGIRKEKDALKLAEVFGGVNASRLAKLDGELADLEIERADESKKLASVRAFEIEQAAKFYDNSDDLNHRIIGAFDSPSVSKLATADEKVINRYNLPAFFAVRKVFSGITGKDDSERLETLEKIRAEWSERLMNWATQAVERCAAILGASVN